LSKLFNRGNDLERELRRNRPEPCTEFLASMVERVGRERRSTTRRMRLGFAGALTAMIVVSLGAFGGLSYAASAVESVAHVATKIVTPSKPQPVKQLSSAGAQYPQKVTICHFDGNGKGHTITVDQASVPAHVAQGDHVGACKPGEFRPNSKAAKAAAKKKAAKKGVLGTSQSGVNPSSTG
jgi:hypothetical protein